MGRGAEKENNYDCHGFDTCGLCCICGNRVSVRIFTGMDAVGYNFDDFYGRGIPGTGKCCIDAKVLEKNTMNMEYRYRQPCQVW